MKEFVIPLLCTIFVLLLADSVESAAADHLEPGEGIFKDQEDVEYVTTHNSDYQVYLQAVLRNGDGQLISVTESTKTASHIPHKITDHVFDTLMGEKKIITIDNIKYEKVQYIFSPTLEQRFLGLYPIYEETKIGLKIEGDVLVRMKEKTKDYNNWKIHYCATFEGHGYVCIPVFQVLVTSVMLEPADVITQQWTILRELN